ncbi:MAG TPA: hypothetical protein VFB80_02350 [Pirellulaceae bacterium]|nr:hypothetical protein [Pirellulaceae bacterium]
MRRDCQTTPCLGRASAIVWLSLFAAAGCGSQTLVPVSGKVTYKKDGQPVTAGLVIFEPLNQKISARGEIQADGTFQLGTHGDNDGAMEGEYKVLIAPPPLPEEGKRLRSPISSKYQNLDSTPLRFTVTRDRNKNKVNLEVE